MNSFILAILSSFIATFLFFWIAFEWLRYGTRIRIERAWVENKEGKFKATNVIICNLTPFTIDVKKAISFYGCTDTQSQKKSYDDERSYVTIPRFGSGSFILKHEVKLSPIVKSVLIRYSTVDMINFVVNKNILEEYRLANESE